MFSGITTSDVTVLSTIVSDSKGFDIKFDGTDNSILYTLNDGEKTFTGKTQTNITLCLTEWCHMVTVWDSLAESFLISTNNGEPYYNSNYTNYTTTTTGSNLKIANGISSGRMYIDEIYIQDDVYNPNSIHILYGKNCSDFIQTIKFSQKNITFCGKL